MNNLFGDVKANSKDFYRYINSLIFGAITAFYAPNFEKVVTYCFRLVRLSVCAYKPMGTPVAKKFGQLDTQVVIFEYK